MNHYTRLLAFALVLLPGAAVAREQEGKKWKPYQFTGDERYEYKVVMMDGDDRKESIFILDVRKKGEADWDVTTSYRNTVKKSVQGAEILMGGMGMGLSPALFLMNPLFGAFLEQVELKEGEKMSLFGAGVIKVTKKETVGGRNGFACELYTKQDDKDQLTWSCTVDPELALPIRSVTYESGKEKYRMDLISYKKD
ncbi:MAG TPA: hypothetical protein VNM14_12870 [Planctomycetota bacterium]|jgi:hypothetical protein|nr:hypothetical protein [Planctomycetota bacterium]